ncbi:MAG: branched-chain amino acid aminotransferase [Defluviitaleaceae bacterium]|nr:branched-chain amino acid aminotransferase [Defluviitaleaceae bacterium]
MPKINVELTKNPKPKPPENALGFGKYFTDHMFVAEYEEGKGWFKADIKPYGPLAMDPSAMVFHYGQAVFEGLKCYRAADGRLLLFRPEKNLERLNTSDERMCIPYIDPKFSMEALIELLKIDRDWVPSAPGTSLYIRPFVIATENALGVHVSSRYLFMIILSPVGAYYESGLDPVKLCIEDEYVRAVRGGTGFTKSSANYAISLKGQVKAYEKGYEQVLWLDGVERRYVEEVGSMNVFFKINGEIVTPALSGSILPGVTRDSVLRLAEMRGLKTSERRIDVAELYDACKNGTLEEAFGSGTAAVISPIGEFNWDDKTFKIADGGIGPVSRWMYDELTGIQYGRLEDPFGWVTQVPI